MTLAYKFYFVLRDNNVVKQAYIIGRIFTREYLLKTLKETCLNYAADSKLKTTYL